MLQRHRPGQASLPFCGAVIDWRRAETPLAAVRGKMFRCCWTWYDGVYVCRAMGRTYNCPCWANSSLQHLIINRYYFIILLEYISFLIVQFLLFFFSRASQPTAMMSAAVHIPSPAAWCNPQKPHNKPPTYTVPIHLTTGIPMQWYASEQHYNEATY